MKTTLLAIGAIVTALPAYADCARSPFTGLVFCGDTAGVFQNEEVPTYTYERPRREVCETRRTFDGFDTTCHQE